MNGHYHILYWRDIPSMVKGKVGRKRHSRPLSVRFMETIDAAAMRTGDTNSDEYLEDWKASESRQTEGDIDAFFDQVVRDIEEQYTNDRLVDLRRSGGWEGANAGAE